MIIKMGNNNCNFSGKKNPFTGKHHSEETKRKISLANKGKHYSINTEFKKGKTYSNEEIEQIRIRSKLLNLHKNLGTGQLGRSPSKEHRMKISIANKGKIKSKEHRMKISLSKRGKKLSKEAIENISKGHIGIKHTQEYKENMRIRMINYIKEVRGYISPNIGRFEKEILDKLETIFGLTINRQFFINGYYLDGYIPELNLAIEIDEKKHDSIKRKFKDKEKEESITKSINCKFLRIKEKDYLNRLRRNNG